jgi:steroid 5-alpha reductase family enzyme
LSAAAIVAALQIYNPSRAVSVLLVVILVVVWACRLLWHILRRFIDSKEQDPRYTAIVDRWPRKNYELQLFAKIFLLQAILATIVSLPVIVLHYFQPELQTLLILGLVVWLVGFLCETIADAQLRRFLRSSNKGELMQSGLWRYSRHPNYFGEIMMWWGIALMTFTTTLWWLGMVGALAISMLIIFVSGVPLAEARAAGKKGWPQYKSKTSVIIPWFPKKSS